MRRVPVGEMTYGNQLLIDGEIESPEDTVAGLRAMLIAIGGDTANPTDDDQKLLNAACAGDPKAAAFFRDRAAVDVDGRVIFNACCRSPMGYLGSGHCSAGFGLHGDAPYRKSAMFLPCPWKSQWTQFVTSFGLPRGLPRPRLRWIVGNYWREIVGCILIVTVLLILIGRLLLAAARRIVG